MTANISCTLTMCRQGSEIAVHISSAALPAAMHLLGTQAEHGAPVGARIQEQLPWQWVWAVAWEWGAVGPLSCAQSSRRSSITPGPQFSKRLSDSHSHMTVLLLFSQILLIG